MIGKAELASSRTVRWGIVGCGDVVARKSGSAFEKARNSRLVSVMRRSSDLAEEFARERGIPHWTTDAGELLDLPEVDVVYVATPPGHHVEYALRACEAGKPCLVEKPVGRSAAECRRIVEAFREKGVSLFASYYRRYLPKFLKVKEILDSGILGPLASAQYRMTCPPRDGGWRLEPRLSGGGLFWDVGSHVVNLLDFWFGPLELIGGCAANSIRTLDVEDTVSFSFRTRHGVPGTALWNFAAREKCDRLEIDGLLGTLRLAALDYSSPLIVETRHPELVSDPTSNGVKWKVRHLVRRLSGSRSKEIRRVYRFQREASVHQGLVQAVVDNLLDEKECTSGGDAALRTSELMDAVLSEYYAGRDDSFWERPSTWRSLRATSALRNYKTALGTVTVPGNRLSEAQVRFFYERGYLGPFKCEAPELDESSFPHKSESLNRHLENPRVMEVCSHPSIVDRVAQLLGSEGVRLFKSRFWVKRAETGKPTPWHQDIGVNNGGFLADGNPVPTITVWLAIDGATEQSGALKVVPGSHRRLFGDWKKNIKADLEKQGALRSLDQDELTVLEAGSSEHALRCGRARDRGEVPIRPSSRVRDRRGDRIPRLTHC